jgi:hypothetical protein
MEKVQNFTSKTIEAMAGHEAEYVLIVHDGMTAIAVTLPDDYPQDAGLGFGEGKSTVVLPSFRFLVPWNVFHLLPRLRW